MASGRAPASMGGRARLFLGISVLWVPLAFLFDGITVLVLPLRVGGDATDLGLVSLVGLGVAAGLQPVAGWLSDRTRDLVDRRVFLAAGAVAALAGLWALAGSTGVAAAIVGYLVLQVGATAMQAAQQTLIPEHIPNGERGRAAGLKTAFDVGGAFLAFAALGAVLAAGQLVPAALLVTIVLVGTVLLVLLLVPASSRPRERPGPRHWSTDVPTGLVPLVASRFLFLFATYAVGRFLVLLVAERLGIAPDRAVDEAGWLLALFTLTTALAAIPIGWFADRRDRRELMAGGALTAAVGIATLVPDAGGPGLIVGGVLMSVGTAAFVTANWAATTDVVPTSDAGRLMAIANLGTGLAAAAAGAIGPFIDASGFTPALAIAATASILSIAPLVIARTSQPITQEHVT
jgi:MFS family permease